MSPISIRDCEVRDRIPELREVVPFDVHSLKGSGVKWEGDSPLKGLTVAALNSEGLLSGGSTASVFFGTQGKQFFSGVLKTGEKAQNKLNLSLLSVGLSLGILPDSTGLTGLFDIVKSNATVTTVATILVAGVALLTGWWNKNRFSAQPTFSLSGEGGSSIQGDKGVEISMPKTFLAKAEKTGGEERKEGDRAGVGNNMMDKLYGPEYAGQVRGRLNQLSPIFAEHAIEFAYGQIWSRPGLKIREKSLITIAALVAQGKEEQTKIHMRGFLESGGTFEELEEALIQLLVYSGFPSTMNALAQYRAVRKEMGDKGSSAVSEGPTKGEDSMEGKQIMDQLYGAEYAEKVRARLEELSPQFAEIAREFAYGKIWTRSGLKIKEKSLVTIAALVAQGKEEQTKIHMRGFLESGGTFEELEEALIHLLVYCGFPAAMNALAQYQTVKKEMGK